VPSKLILLLAVALIGLPALAQQSSESPSQPPAQPQVKVNVLNVCTPSAEEQKEIAGALERIPRHPAFSADFEISHGRSTLDQSANFLQPGQSAKMSDESSVASYVRIRREFTEQTSFASVQYSFSNDGENMVETLVLHVRDPKDLIQVSMEDSASSIGSVQTMVNSDTPASRIRLERFGKSSIALARCQASENGSAPDQSAYEPLFRGASEVLSDYRHLLGVRHTVPAELAQIPAASKKSDEKQKPTSADEKK
jgi:hypothetical protein